LGSVQIKQGLTFPARSHRVCFLPRRLSHWGMPSIRFSCWCLVSLLLPLSSASPQSSAGPAPKPVEITRDNFGVPHVFGATAAAVMFGSGYAMAEDRLADIEVTLRRANGRLAAIEGR